VNDGSKSSDICVGILWRSAFHCDYVEGIGGTATIARLGYIVEKIGTTERILPHAVSQTYGSIFVGRKSPGRCRGFE